MYVREIELLLMPHEIQTSKQNEYVCVCVKEKELLFLLLIKLRPE